VCKKKKKKKMSAVIEIRKENYLIVDTSSGNQKNTERVRVF